MPSRLARRERGAVLLRFVLLGAVISVSLLSAVTFHGVTPAPRDPAEQVQADR